MNRKTNINAFHLLETKDAETTADQTLNGEALTDRSITIYGYILNIEYVFY